MIKYKIASRTECRSNIELGWPFDYSVGLKINILPDLRWVEQTRQGVKGIPQFEFIEVELYVELTKSNKLSGRIEDRSQRFEGFNW